MLSRQPLPTEDCWWIFDDDDEGRDSKELEDGQRIVTAFLDRLTDCPELKTRTIEQFEYWFFRHQRNIKLSEDSSFHLVVGNNNNGLLFEVGSIDGNILSSMAALRLLRKLLSPECCPDANQFLGILSRLDTDSYLRALGFEKFFTHNFPETRADVFYVLESLARVTPGLDVRSVLSNDAKATMEYENWVELRQCTTSSRHLIPQQRPRPVALYASKRDCRTDRQLIVHRPNNSTNHPTHLTRHEHFEHPTPTSSIRDAQLLGLTLSGQSTRRNSSSTPTTAELLRLTEDHKLVADTSHSNLINIAMDPFMFPDSISSSKKDSQPRERSSSVDDAHARTPRLPSVDDSLTGLIPSPIHGGRGSRSGDRDLMFSSLAAVSLKENERDAWQWVRIPPMFEPFNLRLRYRRDLPDFFDRSNPIDLFVLPPSSNATTNKTINKYSELDSSPTGGLSRATARDGVSCNDTVGISSDGRDPDKMLTPPFIVELAMVIPHHASLIAAILFDFRKTIAEALANPLVMETLTTSQIESLINLQSGHWIPKVRSWEEAEVDEGSNWRVSSFIVETSCPPKSLVAVTSERVLTYERGETTSEGPGSYYALFEQDVAFHRFSGVAEVNDYSSHHNKMYSAHFNQRAFAAQTSDKLPSQSSVKQPSTFGSLTPRIGASSSSKDHSINPFNSPTHPHLHTTLKDICTTRNVEYRVSSLGHDSCRVTFMMVLPPQFVGLFSSELLGESAEIYKSIFNIIYLAQTLSPFFSPSNPPSVSAIARDLCHQGSTDSQSNEALFDSAA